MPIYLHAHQTSHLQHLTEADMVHDAPLRRTDFLEMPEPGVVTYEVELQADRSTTQGWSPRSRRTLTADVHDALLIRCLLHGMIRITDLPKERALVLALKASRQAHDIRDQDEDLANQLEDLQMAAIRLVERGYNPSAAFHHN